MVRCEPRLSRGKDLPVGINVWSRDTGEGEPRTTHRIANDRITAPNRAFRAGFPLLRVSGPPYPLTKPSKAPSKRVICATWLWDSVENAAGAGGSLLNVERACVMSCPEKGRGSVSFSRLGMGQGTLSFSKKYPDPLINF